MVNMIIEPIITTAVAVAFRDKISNAIGVLFEPRQIRRIAAAKAEAAKLGAQSKIEITELHQRAVRRWVGEEAQRQENMEDISAKALPHLKEDADPDSIEDDWLVNFFDKYRIVSDQEMQKLWSHVLAGEANVPGTYSKRTVNLLSGLDKAEALLFTKLCGFIVFIEELTPLVFDESAQIYNRHGIDFSSLSHLDSIGLIQYGDLTGFLRKNMPKKVTAGYYQRPIILQLPKDIENDLGIGKVLLTRIGKELAPISGSRPVEGFLEYVKDRWKQYLQEPETLEPAT